MGFRLWLLILAALAAPKSAPAEASDYAADQECLALAIYWEARGESEQGKAAVAWTVLNRRDHPEFPDTVCGVIFDGGESPPCQFSWWCDGKPDTPTQPKSWKKAQELAARLLKDPGQDPTNGALFFHVKTMKVPWRIKRERSVRIGGHIFYR